SLGIDPVRVVSHAQSRVSARLRVRRGAAPVLLEEQRESLNRSLEVMLWVHGPQHRVRANPLIEVAHDRRKRFVPANGVIEALVLGVSRPLPDAHSRSAQSSPLSGGRTSRGPSLSAGAADERPRAFFVFVSTVAPGTWTPIDGTDS